MKQTIEIEVPDGKKAVWKDNKVIFEDIKPRFPKTWEEFCKQNKTNENEYYLDNVSCIVKADIDERHKHTDRNILPNKQAAEAHLALMQLHQLRDCYRQGWIPDWSDTNQEKFSIQITRKNEKGGYSHISTFLTFQNAELSDKFYNNFHELIEQAGDLI